MKGNSKRNGAGGAVNRKILSFGWAFGLGKPDEHSASIKLRNTPKLAYDSYVNR